MFLLFGIKDTDDRNVQPPADWPVMYHADIFAGNILLGSPTGSSFGGFPEVVIADFGRAKCYENQLPNIPHNSRLMKMRQKLSKVKDIHSIGSVLDSISGIYTSAMAQKACLSQLCDNGGEPYEGCVKFEPLILNPEPPEALYEESVMRLASVGLDAHNDMLDALAMLRDFIETATQERAKHIQEVLPEAARYLGKVEISNKELDLALKAAIPETGRMCTTL